MTDPSIPDPSPEIEDTPIDEGGLYLEVFMSNIIKETSEL